MTGPGEGCERGLQAPDAGPEEPETDGLTPLNLPVAGDAHDDAAVAVLAGAHAVVEDGT